MSGLSDFWMRPLLEDQTEESSLVTVKDGRDHVAAVEGVEDGDSDGVGLGVLDGVSELEVLASAEAPAGSTVSWRVCGRRASGDGAVLGEAMWLSWWWGQRNAGAVTRCWASYLSHGSGVESRHSC